MSIGSSRKIRLHRAAQPFGEPRLVFKLEKVNSQALLYSHKCFVGEEENCGVTVPLAGPFEPAKYQDTYRQNLRTLIDSKIGSEKLKLSAGRPVVHLAAMRLHSF